jgi:hypothetical protein
VAELTPPTFDDAPLWGYRDAPPLIVPGAKGYLIVHRRRRWLHWLRVLPGLRRWATVAEQYDLTMTATGFTVDP